MLHFFFDCGFMFMLLKISLISCFYRPLCWHYWKCCKSVLMWLFLGARLHWPAPARYSLWAFRQARYKLASSMVDLGVKRKKKYS